MSRFDHNENILDIQTYDNKINNKQNKNQDKQNSFYKRQNGKSEGIYGLIYII